MDSMDLDLDLDFEEDKIKTFLLNKLREIKYSNDELEASLEARKKFISEEFNQQIDQDSDSEVKIISTPWTKTFCNKYIFGIKTEANDSEFYGVNVTLMWDSEAPLDYKVFTFTENITLAQCTSQTCNLIAQTIALSSKFCKTGYVVVVIDRPLFFDKLELQVSGFITATWNNVIDSSVTVNIPSFKISPLEYTRYQLLDLNLISGIKEDLMAYIACNKSTAFTMVLPSSWNSELDSTFEIHCSLTKVDVKLKCKKMYFAYRISPLFDGSAVIVHCSDKDTTLIYMTIFFMKHNSLVAFLHHLYSNIPGVAFISRKYHENCTDINTEEDSVSKLNKSLKNEVKWIYKCIKEDSTSKMKKSDLREKLCEFEYETDKHYLKVSNKTNDEEN